MSEPKFYRDNLKKLIEIHKGDMEVLDFIFDAIKDFEGYHQSIVEMESWLALYAYGTVGREIYQSILTQMDNARHIRHNAALGRLAALNRMAEQAGVGPIYDGTISEEKPYRRQVANAVLAFLEEVVLARR